MFGKLRIPIVTACAVLALAAVLVGLGRYNVLPEGSEHWTGDWLTRYFSKQLQGPHPHIAVMIVNDETFEKQQLKPGLALNRPWVGNLVTTIATAKPRAIGLDFYYVNPVDEKTDAEFAATLRAVPAPFVLIAAGPQRARTAIQKKFEKDFLASVNRTAGHFYFESPQETLILGDAAVRFINHDPGYGAGVPSFTSQIARLPEVASLHKNAPMTIPDGPQRIDWLLPPPNGGTTFKRIYAHDFMAASPDVRESLVKDKIVLIGSQFNDRSDRHLTPLSISSRNEFPGVTIHAQILAQILEQRWITEWPLWAQFAGVAIIGLLGAFVGQAKTNIWIDIGLGVGGTLLILGLSVLLFYARAPMPTNLAILAWAGGITLGSLFSGFQKPQLA